MSVRPSGQKRKKRVGGAVIKCLMLQVYCKYTISLFVQQPVQSQLPHAKKTPQQKPPFVSKLYSVEPGVTLSPCFQCLFTLFTKVWWRHAGRHHPGPPGFLLRAALMSPAPQFGSSTAGQERQGREGCKGRVHICRATSCTLLLLSLQRRGQGSWSRAAIKWEVWVKRREC